MENKGLFVTFEGLDGAGKTTQVMEVLQYFVEKGRKVISTSEPRGTGIGRELSKLFFSDKVKQFDELTEALVFNAARREHIVRVIEPALRKGYIVLCDRFTDSTLAMQGITREVKILNQIACGDLKPDLTFFIDISAEASEKRMTGRARPKDRFEQRSLTRFQEVRRNYWMLWKAEPERVRMINGVLPVKNQKEVIIKTILEELEKQKNRG